MSSMGRPFYKLFVEQRCGESRSKNEFISYILFDY